MPVLELGHLVLYVRNITRSVTFYESVLGWQRLPLGGRLGGGVAAFSSPNQRTHHELLLIEVGEDAAGVPPGRRVGLYHFGLKVGDSDDELREVRATLLQHNVRIIGATDHGVTHSLYIEDPDGNEIELFIDVPGVDWRTDPTLIASPMKPLKL
ncbi:MAG: VOC family protein [Acidimicrobiales bacterium]